MVYEIHITVETNNIPKFVKDCETLGVKPIVIHTQPSRANMSHGLQVMTASRHHSDFGYKGILKNLSLDLITLGYSILRQKVEIEPTMDRSPLTIYFEAHIKLKIPTGYNLCELRKFCNVFDCHLSRNPFKVFDTYMYQMITYRKNALSGVNFRNNLENVLRELNFSIGENKNLGNNISIEKVELEECIFDSNVSVDDNWLN